MEYNTQCIVQSQTQFGAHLLFTAAIRLRNIIAFLNVFYIVINTYSISVSVRYLHFSFVEAILVVGYVI